MRTFVCCIVGMVWIALLAPAPSAAPASTEIIQTRIDQAEPGAVVFVPAGIYYGHIILKNEITLVGAGIGKSILDGGASRCVVSAGKETALVGFTVRKGVTGVRNQGNFIGIFNCRFEDIPGPSVVISRGTAVIGQNQFIGVDGKTVGISVHTANPYVFNNRIAGHHAGMGITGTQVPFLTRNTFLENKAGIRFYHHAFAQLHDNRFRNNEVEVDGGEVREEIIPDGFADLPVRSTRRARPDALRHLMQVLYPELIATHAKVTYDLRNVRPGQFFVTTEHSTATFAVHAATRNTRIPEYDAYDSATDAALKTEYRPPEKLTAGVAAENLDLTECVQDRYVLDTLYEDAEAWFLAQDGTMRFVRHTNLSRMALLLPQHFELVSFNHKVHRENFKDYTLIEFSDVGLTRLNLVLRRTSATQ